MLLEFQTLAGSSLALQSYRRPPPLVHSATNASSLRRFFLASPQPSCTHLVLPQRFFGVWFCLLLLLLPRSSQVQSSSSSVFPFLQASASGSVFTLQQFRVRDCGLLRVLPLVLRLCRWVLAPGPGCHWFCCWVPLVLPLGPGSWVPLVLLLGSASWSLGFCSSLLPLALLVQSYRHS